MPTLQVNYLAVLVAGIAAFLLGALWYSPALFGRHWVAAHGFTEEQLAAARAGATRAYALSLLCYVLTAWVVAVLASYLHLVRAAGGVKLGALLWLGLAFTIGATGTLFARRSGRLFAIDAGYQLLYLMLIGAIIAGWR